MFRLGKAGGVVPASRGDGRGGGCRIAWCLARHYRVMTSALPTITVKLWRADAVVLFDWLMSVDLNTVPVTHQAQKQALADLLTALECRADADITGSTAEEIAAAQAEVAKDVGR